MSTEVDLQEYLYAPARPEPLPGQTSQETVVPFMHNPLHDLESIFWLSLYLLFMGQLQAIKRKPVVLTADQQNAQHKLVENLSDSSNSAFRLIIMRLNFDILVRHMEGVHPSLVNIARFLANYQYYLHEAFVKAEANLVDYIRFTVAQNVNDDLDQVMKDICEYLGKEDILVDNRVELPKQALTTSATKAALNGEEDGRTAKKLKTRTVTSIQ